VTAGVRRLTVTFQGVDTDYVLVSDYETLQAEVERLRRVCAEWQDKCEAMTDDLHKRQDAFDAEIERLRALLVDTDSPYITESALQGEVERLREERDELVARLGRMEGEYQAAPRMILDRDAEVERLRAALEQIANQGAIDRPDSAHAQAAARAYFQGIARNALAEEKE